MAYKETFISISHVKSCIKRFKIVISLSKIKHLPDDKGTPAIPPNKEVLICTVDSFDTFAGSDAVPILTEITSSGYFHPL